MPRKPNSAAPETKPAEAPGGTKIAAIKAESAAYEGRMGGVLWVASADSGEMLAEIKLDEPPSWDGMAVAQGRLFVVLQDGSLRCFAAK